MYLKIKTINENIIKRKGKGTRSIHYKKSILQENTESFFYYLFKRFSKNHRIVGYI